jgi:hypothetical protein
VDWKDGSNDDVEVNPWDIEVVDSSNKPATTAGSAKATSGSGSISSARPGLAHIRKGKGSPEKRAGAGAGSNIVKGPKGGPASTPIETTAIASKKQ